MASTAAASAPSFSPRPIHLAAARAAASVVRTSSMARFRSGALFSGVTGATLTRQNWASPGEESRRDHNVVRQRCCNNARQRIDFCVMRANAWAMGAQTRPYAVVVRSYAGVMRTDACEMALELLGWWPSSHNE